MGPSLPRLNYLLERYGDGEATPSERLELMEALRAGELEEPVRQWIMTAMEQYDREGAGQEGLSEERAEQLFAAILQSGRVAAGLREEQTLSGRNERMGVMKPAWWRRRSWQAAAILLLVAGIGGYRQFFSRAAHPAVAWQPAKQDVAPGRHAAVLTLAGGQQVSLDSTMSDTVGRQGNTTIINVKGQLTYGTLPAGSAPELAYNTLTTNPGNQYRLILPDGSKVWLNAASSIRFPVSFGDKERKVDITGEAYFEVAANPSRPFLVQYGNMTVKVIGTHFNINTYADEGSVTTTLLEGAVSIEKNGMSRVIRPGQQARLGSEGGISVSDGVNMDEVIAWKNDLFYFRNADIRMIMRQLSRWYALRIEYKEGEIGDHFYARIPRNVPLSDVLDALSLTGKVHFSIEGRTVSVGP